MATSITTVVQLSADKKIFLSSKNFFPRHCRRTVFESVLTDSLSQLKKFCRSPQKRQTAEQFIVINAREFRWSLFIPLDPLPNFALFPRAWRVHYNPITLSDRSLKNTRRLINYRLRVKSFRVTAVSLMPEGMTYFKPLFLVNSNIYVYIGKDHSVDIVHPAHVLLNTKLLNLPNPHIPVFEA